MTNEDQGSLAACRWVLLDFDGPVCSAFAGYPAPEVAADMLQKAVNAGVDVPQALMDESDPMEVMRRLYEISPGFHGEVEEFLTSAEVRSVAAATPVPGAIEFIRACRETERPLAVVSNNSPESIEAFLDKHALSNDVHHVVGRDKRSPRYMKPDPHSVNVALDVLGADASRAVLVGDSVTDIQAAHVAGAVAVGFANRPGKAERFRELEPAVVVTDMRDLERLIRG
ncbi:HAD family phosphatase [Nocardiopsis sp. NPDC049922]|uniref:HAD family hydrolase n=1 Tax=Nocardiopsis sp. NPDC049922 TaxID=3155157 RepID=UPI0033DA2408